MSLETLGARSNIPSPIAAYGATIIQGQMKQILYYPPLPKCLFENGLDPNKWQQILWDNGINPWDLEVGMPLLVPR